MAAVRFQFYPNPDRDFVLQGGQPYYYSSSPGLTSKSKLTDTTQNLSQHVHYPDEYQDGQLARGPLWRAAQSASQVSGNLRKSLMDESSNFRQVSRTYSQAELNEVLREALNSNPPPREVRARADWYIKPIHITEKVRVPMDAEDTLATKFFPVTLGESRSLEMLENVRPASGKGLRQQRHKLDGKTKQRSQSAKPSQQERLHDMYLLTDTAPFIKTADVCFTSPYSEELTKLRLEKLRLQELQYLEIKRQAELERIRGPKPKWYELKSPEFCVEAGKNNELLRHSAQWDDLLRYRDSLVRASTRLRDALAD